MASKKNKEINHNNLVTIKPITDNQKIVFSSWKKDKHQFLFGAAGTGKTFTIANVEAAWPDPTVTPANPFSIAATLFSSTSFVGFIILV